MNWDAIAAITGVVSAIAVVVSLIYLGRQIVQNTRAIKSATWQAIQDAEQRADEAVARDLTAAELFNRGSMHGLTSLEGAERTRYWLIHKSYMDLYQALHYHFEQGTIDEELWRTWVLQIEDGIRNSPMIGVDMIPRLKFLRPSFRKFVESQLENCGIEIDPAALEQGFMPGNG
jgi:hypothetical protein